MTDRPEQQDEPLARGDGRGDGAAERPAAGPLARFDALGAPRRRATLVSLAWTVLVGAYAVGFFGASNARGTAFLDGAFFLVVWAMPLILVWLAAFLAEELARLRGLVAGLDPLAAEMAATRAALDRHPNADRALAEAAATKAALDRLSLGQAEIAARQTELAAGQAELAVGLGALRAAAHAQTASGPARPAHQAAPRPGPARTAVGAASAPADPPPPEPAPAEPDLSWAEIVRAFDFPRHADDAEGFRALKAALQRRSFAQTLQAAEDVLTILSQDGIYMDDLAAAPADPEAWRRFLAGGRGPAVAGLCGVTDVAAVEAAQRLMKADTVFRDTTLFFLRRFDAALRDIAQGARDAEIAEIADTRSGRAFQLMARASGAFD